MPRKTSKLIPFIRNEWKGKEILHRTDRINIKLKINVRKPDAKDIQEKSQAVVQLVENSKLLRVSLKTGKMALAVPEGTDIIKLVERLNKEVNILYAEPDQVGSISVAPNDTRIAEQWALSKINAEAAWDLEKGSANILIAVVDTGISHDGTNLTHPDLNDASRYVLGTDFVNGDAIPLDDHGHGTHVAGTAAAETDNNSGIAGLNWNSPVYVSKIFDANGNGSSGDFESAVEEIVDYAVANNLKVIINLSAGWTSDDESLRDACQYIQDNGMILSVLTHNDSSTNVRFPGRHSLTFTSVIAVGATDSADNVASFSNTGPSVSVVAPGVSILSTFPTYTVNGSTATDFETWDGTSMATPHVTGLASLVWSKEQRLTNEQVRHVIMHTALKLGPGDFNNSWGFGRIQADVAVAKAGWQITQRQVNLNFQDVPEGETQLRAIRLDVNSFHTTSFEVTVLPGAPFTMHNYAPPVTIGVTTDYDTPREVYLWVKYTGTTAGATHSDNTARVRCIETGEIFTITIVANTIARPTCAMMLVLDQSGSMLWPSGVDNLSRERILINSLNIFAQSARQNNGVGMVTFDHDAYDLLQPIAGPLGAVDDPFDTERSKVAAAIANYIANPSGATAIGDGIELGSNNLSGVTGYDKKAIIVFTDGHETASKRISDVSANINEQVFAVGLGTASELNPGALNDICNNRDGYLMLTDHLDNDDTFKLAKYFLQIQAGVNNEDVVVDPSGYIAPGQIIKIPFYLNETDISVDVITMFPVQEILNIAIETPNGDIIDSSNLATFPTAKKVNGQQLTYYRLTLPVDNGGTVHAHKGKWHIVLKIDEKYYKRYVKELNRYPGYYLQGHGIKYTALVHAYSNLRMNCTLSQNQYNPGATIHLRSVITEYGAPLAKDCSITASVLMPDGSTSTILLHKVDTGVYEAQLIAYMQGVYTFTVKAHGHTSRNAAFTREQVRTGIVWKGGDNPQYGISENSTSEHPTIHETLCRFLHCFDKSLSGEARKRLQESGFNLDSLISCTCKKATNTSQIKKKG